MRGKETIVVRRPAEPDWQGDPSGDPEEFTLTGCQLWPRTSTEDTDQGRIILDGWNVFVPPGQPVEVEASDFLVIRGSNFSVVGTPGRYDLKGRGKGTLIVTARAGG
jgi:hypothetical protein